jgi:hypothetical protein
MEKAEAHKKKAKYKVAGVSLPNSVTLSHNNDLFWATTNHTNERFKALFDFCKNHWDTDIYAIVEFEDITPDGQPINGIVTEIIL